MRGNEISEMIVEIGENARAASRVLSVASSEQKEAGLVAMADSIERNARLITEFNALDLLSAVKKGCNKFLVDRILLDSRRLNIIVKKLNYLAALPDPVGRTMAEWTAHSSGMRIKRISTPIGVVGMICESRPSVMTEAAAVCFKSGNAVILEGGSDAFLTLKKIHECLQEGLASVGLPTECMQFSPVSDRSLMNSMLSGLNGNVDVIVPRGSRSLIEEVVQGAKVPVFYHLDGICHLYVDKSADVYMAANVVVNAKLRSPSICNVTECLLIDDECPHDAIRYILNSLAENGCEIRASGEILDLVQSDISGRKFVPIDSNRDLGCKFSDTVITVKLVSGVGSAIQHIEKYSSGHTDGIIATDMDVVNTFFTHVNSAVVMHNTSTRLSDGYEFGFGGETCMATGKVYARGPIGPEQMTSFRYLVSSDGNVGK